MGRSVGPALKAAALLLIFPLFYHERWVCLKIRCWKGELNGGWTEGGVCLRGMSISNCVHCCLLQNISFQKSKKILCVEEQQKCRKTHVDRSYKRFRHEKVLEQRSQAIARQLSV